MQEKNSLDKELVARLPGVERMVRELLSSAASLAVDPLVIDTVDTAGIESRSGKFHVDLSCFDGGWYTDPGERVRTCISFDGTPEDFAHEFEGVADCGYRAGWWWDAYDSPTYHEQNSIDAAFRAQAFLLRIAVAERDRLEGYVELRRKFPDALAEAINALSLSGEIERLCKMYSLYDEGGFGEQLVQRVVLAMTLSLPADIRSAELMRKYLSYLCRRCVRLTEYEKPDSFLDKCGRSPAAFLLLFAIRGATLS